ncbi:MAG: Holliday junction resolvase RuvX [Patescibacteria group bacterium]
MRYLGIDYGTKRIGLALSDDAGTMGFPHSIVGNDGRTLGGVVNLIQKEKVEAIVVGESRSFAGTDNPVAKDARAFAESLTERTGVPVFYEPETFTTQEARRDFEGVHIRKSGNVDSSAAALILTSYLSHTNHG